MGSCSDTDINPSLVTVHSESKKAISGKQLCLI